MSLRTLVLIIAGVSLVIAAAFLILSVSFIHAYVLSLVPDEFVAAISGPVWMVLILQAVALMVLALFLSGFSYYLNTRFIYRPLKDVTDAMHIFIENGTLQALPESPGLPKEVQILNVAYQEFTKRVEAAHARDQEISRVKSDFISTAAHQLRTPLTGVRWALEALQKTPLTPDQKMLIDSAVDKSHDVIGIIGTLLDIGAIESGKYKYTFLPTDIGKEVEAITRDFGPIAQTRQVTLYYVPTDAPMPKVRADKERIKWVLNNLIENAIRYTPANGTVRVYLSTGLGRVFVHVRDTGIGIQAGDRANIFERFYRASNAIQKENAGNGLGLYIARTIAMDHGGDLNFEANTDGPGTTFSLALPVAN
jgi:signal transduction histidine kinase